MGDGKQRREARLTINKEFASLDAFVSEYVSNISQHGAFVRSDEPPAVGTEIDLRFTVIMDDVETIEGVGRVVRIQEDPRGMGVVFTEINRHSQALLQRLLTVREAPVRNGDG